MTKDTDIICMDDEKFLEEFTTYRKEAQQLTEFKNKFHNDVILKLKQYDDLIPKFHQNNYEIGKELVEEYHSVTDDIRQLAVLGDLFVFWEKTNTKPYVEKVLRDKRDMFGSS